MTVPKILARKGGTPVVVLTAYSALMARILDEHVDILLVGDSMGTVVYGMPDTLGVTLDMSIAHGAAVVRGSRAACVIVDMPFATYQESPAMAYRNCARVMRETGCAGVKLEGGAEMAETIRFLVERGIPVMGHVGLKPQSLNTAGGYVSQGRDQAAANRILADAVAVADAGAFSMVIEATVEPLARKITETVPAITIGIGASAACDGQVLVIDDVLGMDPSFAPKYVKRYADLNAVIGKAAAAYAKDVKARKYPAAEHYYGKK